jgi:hypothetical protein
MTLMLFSIFTIINTLKYQLNLYYVAMQKIRDELTYYIIIMIVQYKNQ